MKLSLIVPCYNEGENVKIFYDEVRRVFLDKVESYEIVFVNDGSRDNTYQRLKEIRAESEDIPIQILTFSRNFGKEAAIYAGLEKARGERICIIDADLQQRPEVVLEMMSVMDCDEDIDCVTAYQEKRKENKLISAIKSLFYKIINKISEVDFVSGASDFRLFKRCVRDAILSMSEFHRFSKGIFGYVGFNTKYIPYSAEKRQHGKSKWGVGRLFRYALDGIYAFSTAPLKISTFVGFLSSLCSIIYLIAVVIQKLAFGIDVPGYATLVVLILLIGGIQLFCLGILGEYLARMYIQVKTRPIYVLKEHLGGEDE